MPNPSQPDRLSVRLSSLLHHTEAALSSDIESEDLDPAPSAGGIPIMVITDLPLAATPDKYKAPPITPAEEAALRQIRESMDMKYSPVPPSEPAYTPPTSFVQPLHPGPGPISDIFFRTSAKHDSYEFPPPMSPAPTSDPLPQYDSPEVPATIQSSVDYIPYRNTVLAGRNHVPSGLYRLMQDTVVVTCKPNSSKTKAAHARHLAVSGSDDNRTVCVLDVCNGVDVDTDLHDDTPHFYGILWDAVKGAPQFCRVSLSSVQEFQPRLSEELLTLMTKAKSFALSLGAFVTSPVPAVLANTSVCPASLVEPEMLSATTSSFQVAPIDALSALLPLVYQMSSVNQEDADIIKDHLAEIAKLEAKRQLHLNTLASIASKYTRGNIGARES